MALAAFALVGFLGVSAPARAGFVLTIEDVTAGVSKSFTFGVANSEKVDTTVGGVERMTIITTVGSIDFTAEVGRSNTPGTPTLAFTDQSGNGITNLDTANAHDVRISITSTDFTAPTTPPDLLLDSRLTANVVEGNVSGATFNSYIGTGNGEFEQSIAAPTVGPISTGGVGGGETTKLITSLAGPYSLSSVLVATLSAGATVTQLSGNTHLNVAVPEPSSIVALAAAVPVMTLALRRRRAAK